MTIHPIQTGTVVVKANQVVGKGRGIARQLNTLLGSEWTAPLPILAWAIDHPEGLFVVDTGESALVNQPGYFPWWHPYFHWAVRMQVAADEEVGPRLGQLGIASADVKSVVLTHLHTDHAGGLKHFPGCDVLVHDTELAAATGPGAVLAGYLPHNWPAGLAPRVIEFEATGGPFDSVHYLTRARDVMIVPTPGHTRGHVSVIVRHAGVSYFLAGDTTYTERALVERLVDGISPRPRRSLRTIERILAFAAAEPTVYLPTHDPTSLERLERATVLVADGLASSADATPDWT
jgi:glyoxylase-like metal-dependent hydrolase (beta-lactamase superfamily II)